MAQRIPIQLHVANALRWLGSLYRNPADALKEHVSNAIDEHLQAQLDGTAHDRCHVRFTLDRPRIIVEYPYGMSRQEFEAALQRVADSAKRASGLRTIGRLGIGIFSFQQIGRKCTFYSRKTVAGETLRVTLKEGSDQAVVETALARERLAEPGLRVVVSELKFDPTRPRGPLVGGVVQANTLHPDYEHAARSTESRLAYAALMIGKETIAFNDRSGAVGDFLEKLLDFYFKLQVRTRVGRPRGRRGLEEQPPLDLSS